MAKNRAIVGLYEVTKGNVPRDPDSGGSMVLQPENCVPLNNSPLPPKESEMLMVDVPVYS
jgi:hypothetical protein